MDAERIRGLRVELGDYLGQFDDCFSNCATRAHLPVYVRGQLSDLPRKSVEPMALIEGVAPRTLQEFLSFLDWDDRLMIDRVQQLVARDHVSPHSVGVIDETGCPKKGDKTPGVQRQYCGATGKIDNCVVTVHLSYAVDDFHCLLESDLYLPESWAADRDRCRRAGIPDEVVYRPKWRIALELLDRALTNGVGFTWLTFDEHYGSKPEFLHELDRRHQRYVAEVPVNFRGWLQPTRLRTSGRRLCVQRPSSTVADLLRYSPTLRDQPWRQFRVKDGEKGPMVWEVKHVRFYPQLEDGDPGKPGHLLVARNVLEPDKIKYFVSNGPPETRCQTLLLAAFSRWHVERCFEDEKTELGFDHYEGRKYQGLIRHQALTAVTHLFLERTRVQWGEKSRPHRLSTPYGRCRLGAILVLDKKCGPETSGTHGRHHPVSTTPERQGTKEPHETDAPETSQTWHSSHHPEPMLMG
jgi:SRSO17 transposase